MLLFGLWFVQRRCSNYSSSVSTWCVRVYYISKCLMIRERYGVMGLTSFLFPVGVGPGELHIIYIFSFLPSVLKGNASFVSPLS